MPTVSVIVTTFNRKELLSNTINSILNQTFSDFELIIIDNYSNYDFNTLISEFNDQRILAYQNENNGIIAINRNYGMKVAKGEFIALCDDDDLWVPDKLEKQINLLKAKENYSLVCTGVTFFGDDTNFGKQSIFSKMIFKILAYNIINAKYSLLLLTFITNSSVFFRKQIISNIGYLNETIEYRSVEDFDYWLRISLKFKIYYLNEKLVRYRFHESQISSHNLKETKIKTDRVIRNNWNYFNKVQKLLCSIFILNKK
jgi:glycosyltransferase involved in cell wall biosynthesis